MLALSSPQAYSQQTGMASWYSRKDPGIKRYTANQEVFCDKKRTCASWHYRFGTYLSITNVKNGKSVVCRVNDRGPAKQYKKKRIVDLTRAAFKEIGDLKTGLIAVRVSPVKK